MTEVMREAYRITHWKLHSAEGFYWLQTFLRVEEAGLLGCFAVCLGNFFRRFRDTYRPHLQAYESMNALIILKMTAVRVFESSGIAHPHGSTTYKTWFLRITRWKPEIAVFVLLRIYLIPFISCSSFIVCMTGFLEEKETLQVFIIVGCQSAWIHNSATFKR